MAKKNSSYFDDFIIMSSLSVKAAEHLQRVLSNFDPSNLADQRQAMHDIEHEEDVIRHNVMTKLAKEFVTPIDREDIIRLANELDNVTDKIDDILTRIYMYNITEIRPESIKFADVIVRCCNSLAIALKEFPNFQKSAQLRQAIIDVNTMEEEGDAIYIDTMRRLYRSEDDAINVLTWSELFDRLEDCCDACEDVADLMETIAMKNS